MLNWSLNENFINENELPENQKKNRNLISTPTNKMGVTKNEFTMDTADWDLITPFEREFPTPYMHMVMTSKGVKPVQCRLPADNEIAVIDWVNFTIGIETISTQLLDDQEYPLEEYRW